MDMNKMSYEQQKSLDKLLKNQNNDGGLAMVQRRI